MTHKHYSSWRNFYLQELFTYNENSESGIHLQELNGTNKKNNYSNQNAWR
jgi:hypothetical protein